MNLFVVFVVVMFIGFFAVVGGVGWMLVRSDRRNRRAVAVPPVGDPTTPDELLAASHGFRLDSAAKKLPPQEFAAFDWLQGPRVVNQIWRDGATDSAFQLMYSTTDDRHRRRLHEHATVALLEVPFEAPHTRIGPERSAGADIDIESPTFNDRYRVTGDDERFAVALLDQNFVGRLLDIDDRAGEARIEFLGSWMLIQVDHLGLDQMFGFHDWAQNVRDQVPTVLASLYPTDD